MAEKEGSCAICRRNSTDFMFGGSKVVRDASVCGDCATTILNNWSPTEWHSALTAAVDGARRAWDFALAEADQVIASARAPVSHGPGESRFSVRGRRRR